MKFIKLALLSLLSSAVAVEVTAQEAPPVQNPPVSLETFAGSRGFSYQMIVNKKFQSVPKLGFFSVTNFQAEWGEPKVNDYMLQGNLTYSLIKGIDLSGGFIWNPIDGIRPSAGIIFSYGNPELLIVANPRIDLTKKANFDALVLVEYKPKVSEKLNLYSRAQGLYTHNLGNDLHARSYIMLRAGLTFRDISFGAAANFDWYGPMKINQNNVGGFVLVNLF